VRIFDVDGQCGVDRTDTTAATTLTREHSAVVKASFTAVDSSGAARRAEYADFAGLRAPVAR
jgi:hypothetical protein